MNFLNHELIASQHPEAYDLLGSQLKESVASGYRKMASSTVTIAGLSRSIAQILPRTIENIERLGSRFCNYQVIVFENDSADNTLELLQDWATRNPRIKVVSENLNAPISQPIRCLNRADRMVYYRSRLQQNVLEQPNPDYVILVDMDLEGGWSLDGIATTFARSDWDFVGSSGLIYKRKGFNANSTVQYDAWAYRERGSDRPLSTKYVNRLTFKPGSDWILLNSCFGGLGIYTGESYAAGQYSGGDIEHVTFHRSLREKGFNRIFLNPNQIVYYGRKSRRFDRAFRTIHELMKTIPILKLEPWQFDDTLNHQIRPKKTAA